MNDTLPLFPDPKPPACEHRNVKFTPTPDLIHYGREDCLDCYKFIRWLAYPPDVVRSKTKPAHDPNDIVP